MRLIRSHLTYANVMATIAVFLVLGGGAYAAFHLPKNSVRSKNIVNGQVKRADVSNSLGFKCPSSTRYFEGACIETKARNAANWFDASTTCTNLGRRLPSVAELDGFRLEPHIALVGFEWTSDFANVDNTTGSEESVVSDEGENDFGDHSQLHSYRCVARAKR
jgi:hypothetical protein